MSNKLWQQAQQLGREKDKHKPGADKKLERVIRKLRKQYGPVKTNT